MGSLGYLFSLILNLDVFLALVEAEGSSLSDYYPLSDRARLLGAR